MHYDVVTRLFLLVKSMRANDRPALGPVYRRHALLVEDLGGVRCVFIPFFLCLWFHGAGSERCLDRWEAYVDYSNEWDIN